MTANELIKILKEGWYTSDYDTVAASEVVCKLQSEIEELKNGQNIDQMSSPVGYMTKEGYVYGKHETRPIEADIPLYTHTQSHPIEPVAKRYDFDGYGYMYIDSGSGSDWKTREKGELLYTKPFFSQKPVAMMVKIDGFDKPEFTTTCSSDALKHPNYTALYDHPPIAFVELEAGESIPLYTHSDTQSHPMQELSHEEIDNIFGICALNTTVTLTTEQCYWIVDAILKKAREE